MTVSVYSYTIYHSPNAHLGTVLLRRAVSDLPGVELVRRPICVPRERGLMIADLLVVGTKQMIPSAPLTSRLLRRSAPRNDGCLRCHCERSEAISAMGGPGTRCQVRTPSALGSRKPG